MTCRCRPRPGQRWPVTRATWHADRWTITRLHDMAVCGMADELLDPMAWRTR